MLYFLFTSIHSDENSETFLSDVQVRTSSVKPLQNGFPGAFFRGRDFRCHLALAERRTLKWRNILTIVLFSSKVFLLEYFLLPHYRNLLPHIFASIEHSRAVNPWLAGVVMLNWVTVSTFLSIVFHLLRILFS